MKLMFTTIFVCLSIGIACDSPDLPHAAEDAIAQQLGDDWTAEAPGLWTTLTIEGATVRRAFGEPGRISLCEVFANTPVSSLQDSMFESQEEFEAFCADDDSASATFDVTSEVADPIAMTCEATFGAKCFCDACSAGLFKCQCNNTPKPSTEP